MLHDRKSLLSGLIPFDSGQRKMVRLRHFRLNTFFEMTLRHIMELGHVDKWRSQMRIEVMSMKPRKLSAVLS